MFDFPVTSTINTEVAFPGGPSYIWDGQKWCTKKGKPPFEPAPLIASIDPTQANQNEIIQLTVNGTYFEDITLITLDGIDAVTSYMGTTMLSTVVPAQPYGTTSIAVNVRTGTLLGPNADKILTLIDPRVPLITAVAPTTGSQGAAFSITVTGTNFWGATQVTINGAPVATTFVSGTELTAQVPVQAYGPVATLAVNVKSQAIVGTNPDLTITVTDTRTTFSAVSPLVGTQNEALTLTVTGAYFTASSQITVGGAAIATTFVSATQLTCSYTCPYFNPTELGQVNKSIGVTGSISPPINVNFLDPRFKIRSTYPDYYSEWTPNVNHIEVWGWGIMAADSVVYIDRMGGAGPEPRSTWIDPNAVGTELILVFDINPAPEYDAMCKLTVLNKGIHWSAGSFDFWCEDIG